MKESIIILFSLFTAALVTADDLPTPLPPSTYSSLLKSSPFTRALNLSDSLILSGLARVDNEPVATILDKETNQTHVVSSQTNQKGWRLSEVTGEGGLDTLQVTLDVNGQLVTIRHNPDAVADSAPKVSSGGGSGGRHGGRGDGDGKKGGGGGFRPDPELMKRFYSLSEESRQKFREEMMKNREKMGDLSAEDRMANFKQTVDRLQAAEKGK